MLQLTISRIWIGNSSTEDDRNKSKNVKTRQNHQFPSFTTFRADSTKTPSYKVTIKTTSGSSLVEHGWMRGRSSHLTAFDTKGRAVPLTSSPARTNWTIKVPYLTVLCRQLFRKIIEGSKVFIRQMWGATLGGHALEGHTLTLLVRFFRKVRFVVLATGVRVWSDVWMWTWWRSAVSA